MKYRSRTEIIDSLLRGIGSGATKTQIMYRSYLSYAQLKVYVALCMEKELIRLEPEENKYQLTSKGLQFMNAFDDIKEVVPSTDDMNDSRRQALRKDF